MPYREFFRACIDACYACADACDHCATSSQTEYDIRAMTRCIRLSTECGELCRLAAAYMARGSELASIICTACGMICEVCADECARHEMPHCQECANACRRCAEECQRIVASKVPATAPHAGVPAH